MPEHMDGEGPDQRRDTPLARKLIARIRAQGPIPVQAYMNACLNDPEHGYYRHHQAIGRDGDFVTAPEISQVFGELLGLWCVVAWQQMGRPARVNLIELGAGRGTLLADALRAARVAPDFMAAVGVHILDCNPVLIAQQKAALAAVGIDGTWHATLPYLWEGLSRGPVAVAPCLWLANEFLDTFPVAQTKWRDGAWHVRAVGLDATGRLAYVPTPAGWTTPDGQAPDEGEPDERDSAATGAIRERQDFAPLAAVLSACAARAPCAGVFIDYGGTAPATSETLQAVRRHRAEHVLASPGEADLSVQVDFSAFALALGSRLIVDGPTTQAEFLGRLGITERASRLMAVNPERANTLETGIARLMAPQGMGSRFKVIGVRSPNLPPLAGF